MTVCTVADARAPLTVLSVTASGARPRRPHSTAAPRWGRRLGRLALLGLGVVALPPALGAPSPGAAPDLVTVPAVAPHVISRAFPVMGTEVSFSIFTADAALADKAFAAGYDEMKRVERLMTDWEHPGEPPSDIVRVNAAAGKQAVKVSDETIAVVQKALEMSAASGGAFDITFAAMKGLWKFDEDLEARLPDEKEIAARRKLINWRDVVVDRKAHTLKLRRVGMRIGLGGIAKGYAVDTTAALFKKMGLADFMVQAGGDLYVSGSKGPAPWMVGVRDPRGRPQDVIAKSPIRDHAFSTAGDYERAFVLDGKRYHHIIDPKTGHPAMASRSVTIFAPNAFLADAIDDAVFILGPEKGLALCARYPDTSALIVDAANKVWRSPGLPRDLQLLRAPSDGP